MNVFWFYNMLVPILHWSEMHICRIRITYYSYSEIVVKSIPCLPDSNFSDKINQETLIYLILISSEIYTNVLKIKYRGGIALVYSHFHLHISVWFWPTEHNFFIEAFLRYLFKKFFFYNFLVQSRVLIDIFLKIKGNRAIYNLFHCN